MNIQTMHILTTWITYKVPESIAVSIRAIPKNWDPVGGDENILEPHTLETGTTNEDGYPILKLPRGVSRPEIWVGIHSE